MYTIYTLTDPRTNEVRYVGCTLDVKRRFTDHMRNNSGNAAKRAWISELKALDTMPTLTIIECNLKEPDCFRREAYWIEHYRNQGMPLTSTRITKSRNSAVRCVWTQDQYDREIRMGRKAILRWD